MKKSTLLICALAIFSLFANASAKPKRIVTTFTIIQDIAQNVAGDAAVVESITKPGAEIHEYEPTPMDIVKAQSADLVLWNGMGLERWFEKFFGSIKNVPSVVLTDGVEPMGIKEGPYNGKPNPHSWMAPANAIIYVENIRKALVKLDPPNAATYNANAAAYTAKLQSIDEPIRNKLAEIPEAQRWLVSSEGAFSYLIRNYGMKELYLWPVNADSEGTPQQVRKVGKTRFPSFSARAPSATNPPGRWRRKQARVTAACSMLTPSRPPMDRLLPTSKCSNTTPPPS
jgi:manganese/iron transport system substrate-binding protein